MPRQSLVEYLNELERWRGDIACVHRRGYRRETWSYRQVAEGARRFARELEAWEVNRGSRVMIWGESCAEWVIAFWGCLLRGAVVVPMDKVATPEFAQRVAREVDAKLLVRAAELHLPDRNAPALVFEELAGKLAARRSDPYRGPELARGDIAEIIFTSGTTADPKGVVLTHGNILANLEPLETEIAKYRRYERIVHPLRFLNLLPLSHVFGQFMGLLVPPLLGGTVVFLNTANPSEVMRTIKKEKVSVLVAVPRMMESLKDKIERDVESAGQMERFREQFKIAEKERFWKRIWRFRATHRQLGWKFWALISGGAALDADTEAFWNRLGFAVIQGYGMTETASLISLNHPFRLGKGSIGRSLPGREIKLSEDGEILVRGESIAAGYWHARQLEPMAAPTGESREEPREDEGWFRTGDLGVFDEQGNLYFKGRKKNVIVTAAGMNVHPEDLEAALRRQPEVRDCVVVGVARAGSRDINDEPCAVLILRSTANEGTEGAVAGVVQRANESLAEYQRMRCWLVWSSEDFPRTSTGKPRVNLIREAAEKHFRAGAAEPGAQAASLSPLGGLIARITGRTAGVLAANANLQTDLNLTSLDRVELLSALEDRFQTELSETQFSAATTVADLEQLLRQPVTRHSEHSAEHPAEYPYARWPQWPAVAVVRSFVYYLLVWTATSVLAWPRVRGREHLRDLTGPALFISNHIIEHDVGFVLKALPHRWRCRLAVAMNGERLRDLRHPPASRNFFLRSVDRLSYIAVCAFFNVFPMPKQSGVRGSFQFAGETVDRGQSILVFPEGQLTKDGGVMPFRSGIGVLAKTLNVPVVPMRIDGLYKLKLKGRRFAWPGTVSVTIGTPQRFAPGAEPEQITRELQEQVEQLHPEA